MADSDLFKDVDLERQGGFVGYDCKPKRANIVWSGSKRIEGMAYTKFPEERGSDSVPIVGDDTSVEDSLEEWRR